MAHGAIHFTGNASHREQQDADSATRKDQRGGNVQHIHPAGPSHGESVGLLPAPLLIWIKLTAEAPLMLKVEYSHL